MSTVTDLTWTQLDTALKTLLGSNVDVIVSGNEGEVTIKVHSILKKDIGMTSDDVIKFMNIMHDAAVLAQTTANTGKATGEKLNSFTPPIAGNAANNFMPLTRTIISRADLRTATNITGTNV